MKMIILKCNKNRKRVDKYMKKLSSKGFTLIELLAVITIMGILMMVAIPSVSRTIENARRDTFADVAHQYINAVRNAALADNLKCGSTVYSGTADGWYYFRIDTDGDQGTKDLMESGGKSSFGNAELKGYVVWHKYTSTDSTRSAKNAYYMSLVDTGKHGFVELVPEADITRAKVSTAVSGEITDGNSASVSMTIGTVTIDKAPIKCELY